MYKNNPIKIMSKFKNFSTYLKESIENEPRINEQLVKILNEQIKNELQSSQIYRGMACWLDDNGWISASKYFFKSGQEELIHMDKIYNYLFDRNCLAKVPTCDLVKQEFTDLKEILEDSLKHEIEVSKNWNDIANLALKLNDNTTYVFSQWFQNEQVEEEIKFRDLIFYLNLDTPKHQMEKKFKSLLENN
jgi:ferritin